MFYLNSRIRVKYIVQFFVRILYILLYSFCANHSGLDEPEILTTHQGIYIVSFKQFSRNVKNFLFIITQKHI